MKIWAHTLVRNEERWIWYAVMSVINHVDKVLIWDTGSTDKTVEIIKEIQKKMGDKVEFREYGSVVPQTFPKARQEMLEKTDADWILVLDGDEVWWEESIKGVIEVIKRANKDLIGIVVPFYQAIGDIFHYQEEVAGRYSILRKTGHLTVRAIKKVPGLEVSGVHPNEAFVLGGKKIQELEKNLIFLNAPFLHLTHIKKGKMKFELGENLPLDFYYPEVFFMPRPDIVPSPWVKMDAGFLLRAFFETPLKRTRRRVK